MPKTLLHKGARLSYDVVGQGPAVLLGHSLLLDRHMWDAVVPTLARRYRVITVDARGHGESTSPAPFTLEDLAGDIGAILDREGIRRAVVGGLSMGGMSAMRFALTQPDRVEALLLVDSNADAEHAIKRLRYHLLGRIVRTFGHVGWVYRIALELLVGKTTLRERPAVVAAVLERLHANDPRALPYPLAAVFDRPGIVERIRAITAPTLVLVGDEDVATPRLCSERICAAIPRARLRVVRDAGHLSAMEAPDEVAREILTFLEEVAPEVQSTRP